MLLRQFVYIRSWQIGRRGDDQCAISGAAPYHLQHAALMTQIDGS